MNVIFQERRISSGGSIWEKADLLDWLHSHSSAGGMLSVMLLAQLSWNLAQHPQSRVLTCQPHAWPPRPCWKLEGHRGVPPGCSVGTQVSGSTPPPRLARPPAGPLRYHVAQPCERSWASCSPEKEKDGVHLGLMSFLLSSKQI